MNRIEAIFQELKSRQAKALMPFVTAGDPDLQTTASIIEALDQAGVSVIELGIPFSDPIADGPIIQASMSRALDAGVTVEAIFEMVRSLRDRIKAGLVAMVSYSIVYRYGLEHFVKQAAEVGFDGFIFPDLPIEEANAVQKIVQSHGLIMSMLIAPTTSTQRAQQIAADSSGFIYVLSRAGVTGEQQSLPTDLSDRLTALRQVTDLPLAVGFGISNAQQVAQVVSVADAAIVGSALVRCAQENHEGGKDVLIQAVSDFAKTMCEGLTTQHTEV